MVKPTLNDLQYTALTQGQVVSASTVFPNKLVLSTGTFVAGTTGAAATHPLFNVTGVVAVSIFGVCSVDLTTGGATTLEVGTASSTAGLLSQITATNWDANEVWEMTDANLNKLVADSLLVKKIVTESTIDLKITTSTVTGGSAKFYLSWYPISDDGNVTVVSPFA
jgi:hypothetical protein